jgi:hypothetical protein
MAAMKAASCGAAINENSWRNGGLARRRAAHLRLRRRVMKAAGNGHRRQWRAAAIMAGISMAAGSGIGALAAVARRMQPSAWRHQRHLWLASGVTSSVAASWRCLRNSAAKWRRKLAAAENIAMASFSSAGSVSGESQPSASAPVAQPAPAFGVSLFWRKRINGGLQPASWPQRSFNGGVAADENS